MIDSVLGGSVGGFLGVTVVMTGFAAYMTGQALGAGWKPFWQLLAYCALLGAAARFLEFALVGGELFSPSGYVAGTIVLTAIGAFAFRLSRARKMVNQYPWLYRRHGLFGWRPLVADHDRG